VVEGNGMNKKNSKTCSYIHAEDLHRILRNRKRSRNLNCNLAPAKLLI